jgi:hypothetical protein
MTVSSDDTVERSVFNSFYDKHLREEIREASHIWCEIFNIWLAAGRQGMLKTSHAAAPQEVSST